jgi:hypothetical protein
LRNWRNLSARELITIAGRLISARPTFSETRQVARRLDQDGREETAHTDQNAAEQESQTMPFMRSGAGAFDLDFGHHRPRHLVA